MYPIVFEVGAQPVYGYWFFYGLGLLCGMLLLLSLGAMRSLPFWRVWLTCFVVAIAVLAVGRISFVLYAPGFNPFTTLRDGGEVSFGGALGAVAAIILCGATLRLRLPDLMDAAAPAILLGGAIGRIGCFCNGCCFGPVFDSILSVRFPQIINPKGMIIGSPCFQHQLHLGWVTSADLYSLPVFPMQLLSSLARLLLAMVGVWLYLRGSLRGRLLWLMFVLYGVVRFAMQWFRPNYDETNEIWGWNSGHTFSLLLCAVGAVMLWATARFASRSTIPDKFQRRLANPNRSKEDLARLRSIAARRAKG